MIAWSRTLVLVVAAIACRDRPRGADEARPPPPVVPIPTAPAPADADAAPHDDAGSAEQPDLLVHLASLAGVRRGDYFRFINERAYPRFQRCYPAGALGNTTIDFDVGVGGAIAARLGSGSDADVARCLVDVLDLIHLPAGNAGGRGEIVFEARP
jgi:hypothetical protein